LVSERSLLSHAFGVLEMLNVSKTIRLWTGTVCP
jgi:hypothetical protein